MIRLLDADLWPLLLCTVRYAMGRSSYVTGDVCDYVRRYSKHLTAWQRGQIREEIEKELRRAEDRGETLGHRCDHEGWAGLVREMATNDGRAA